jgi:folate-binding protein YgfZ
MVGLYPGAGVPRALLIVPAGAEAPQAPAMTPAEWDWLEVMSGIAMITPAVAEAFVPQMLNYESVGGVNFKKGCYPGQEVVARSQFRGTLKRRAFLVSGPAAMTVGQDVFHSGDAEQACGTVAAAAPTPGAEPGAHTAIVSMPLAAAQGGSLHLGAADGPRLEPLPLPYPLLADV